MYAVRMYTYYEVSLSYTSCECLTHKENNEGTYQLILCWFDPIQHNLWQNSEKHLNSWNALTRDYGSMSYEEYIRDKSAQLLWTHVLLAYFVVELFFLYHITLSFPVCMIIHLLFRTHVHVSRDCPQHTTFMLRCCIVPLLYCSVVTHIHIFPCILIIMILVRSYNAYRYIGDLIRMVDHTPAFVQPGSASRSPPPTTVSTVSIKLPPFWSADSQVWFAQVEAQFSTRHINQRTCFDYVVAALAPEFTTEVRDLLLAPPHTKPYNVIKAQLIQRTAASEQCRFQQLYTAEELGDKKPLQLLCRMQQLLSYAAGPNPDNKFLHKLFLQRLPIQVRMVLASSGEMSLEAMAQLADKITEVATPSISTLNPSPLRQK